MSTRLEHILSKFTKNGLSEDDRQIIIGSNKAPHVFHDIAKEILSGYFEVKSGDSIVKVIPTTVEIYYHEEQGEIKDYIVYHRNSQKEKKPIFQLGILHNHVSGIDITFERIDDDKITRASALIREYRVEGKDVIERRSTKLYEALFSEFNIFEGFTISWKDSELVNTIQSKVRKNAVQYNNENKIPASNASADTVLTENKKYVQCPRLWQFSKMGSI